MVLIVHLIFEDTTSAYSFWSEWANEFLSNSTYYCKANGNKGLDREFMRAVESAKIGDTIFLIFDNIVSETFDYADFLSNCQSICLKNDINLEFTDYYCFEELFLSCTVLKSLLSDTLINIISDNIHSGNNYFEDETVLCELELLNLNHLNRETVSNALLSKYTQRITGDFQIMKKSDIFTTIGKCWTLSCKKVHEKWDNEYKVTNICSKCNYNNFCAEQRSKLKKIIESSVLSDNNWIMLQMQDNNAIKKITAF